MQKTNWEDTQEKFNNVAGKGYFLEIFLKITQKILKYKNSLTLNSNCKYHTRKAL